VGVELRRVVGEVVNMGTIEILIIHLEGIEQRKIPTARRVWGV
jgi:hypothetical protein